MNRLVVDANIVMNLLITPSGKTAVAFAYIPVPLYSHSWLLEEIAEHWDRIQIKTRIASPRDLDQQLDRIASNITIIDDPAIPLGLAIHAGKVLNSVDADDAPYYALALHLDCPIWTGDKILRNALHGIHTCYSSDDLIRHFGVGQVEKPR